MTMTLLQPHALCSEEHRRDVRVAFHRRAWCEHRDWTLYLTVSNLSRGGMFIQTSAGFAPGELLRVCVAENEPRILVEVEVVWSRSRGRTLGIGCRVAGFVQGAEHYGPLIERLSHSTW